MNKHLKSIIALAGALCVLPLGSAYAEDNTSTIISGTTTDFAGGTYFLGTDGTNNLLQIDSGGQLINCSASWIGFNAGASNNLALVTGSGSTWNAGALNFGYYGKDNVLKIADGGTVNSVAVIMGYSWAGGNGNVVVTDSGSYWNVGGSITLEGNNSSLTVSNGASLGGLSGFASTYVGYAGNSKILVTGAGSTWNNAGTYFLLAEGGNNTLTIADGGLFDCPTTAVAIGFSGNNDHALVTGAGSLIDVGTQPFYVGDGGSGSSLVVSNGGTVATTGTIFLGIGHNNNNNTITVTGPGSTLDNMTGSNPLWIGYYTDDTNNILNVGNGGLLKSFVVVATGTNGVFNLGDGTTLATANTYYVELRDPTARMNINAGVLQPRLTMGNMIFGDGAANNVYIKSGGLVIDGSTLDCGIQVPLREDPASTGGGLTKIGAKTFTLGGANTYAGITTVSNGTLLVSGSIGTGAVSVKSGASLMGGGVINGPVTVEAGATLQPGYGGLDTSTLTINNTLTLAGTTLMTLNRTNAQTASKVSVTTLILGGTLTVTNAGDALQAGDTFTLASVSSSLSGVFTATNLPSLAPPLTWKFLNNGKLTVVDPTPTSIVPGVSGSTLTLTWPGSSLGWYAQSNSVSLANSSAWYDITGSQTATNLVITINPATPQVFYRLRLP